MDVFEHNQMMTDNDVHDNQAMEEVPAVPDSALPPSPPTFVPPPTRSGRPRKFPAIFKDFLPTSTSRVPHTRVPHMPPPPPPQNIPAITQPALPELELPSSATITSEDVVMDTTFTTEPDEFGLFRVYPRKPYHEPDDDLTLNDICEDAAQQSSGNPDSCRWWKGFNPEMNEDEATSSTNPFTPLTQ